MKLPVTVNDLLDGHVGLDIECLDRISLNGYVPNLQVSGQVATFLTRHLGYPIPSPAIFEKIGTRFRDDVRRDAAVRGVPVIKFAKGDRPDHVEIIFGRKLNRDKVTTFHTAIDRHNQGVVINANFKHSRIKQYCELLKDGRALRIETVINNPTDLGFLRRLEHLPELQAKVRPRPGQGP